MVQPGALNAGLAAAAAQGRIGAVAAAGQRDMHRCATRFDDLFPSNPFDFALFGAVALANAFCAPTLSADQLRIANRTTLWAFAVDWLIDYHATSPVEVDDIVGRCTDTALGAQPAANDSLTRLMAEIRDE